MFLLDILFHRELLLDKSSAGVTQAFSGIIGTIGSKGARLIAAATIGGVASELNGGKFANGAVTAAFSRAFNDEAHSTEEERVGDARKKFDRALNAQFSKAKQLLVAYNDPVLDSNYQGYDLGGFLFEGDTNGIFGEKAVIAGFTLDKVGINSPSGVVESPGLFSGNTAGAIQKGAAALVVVTFSSTSNRPDSFYQNISRNINAPVFVSNVNSPTIIRFTQRSVDRYELRFSSE